TQNPNQLCVFKMNRWQNELELLLADAKTGETKTLLKEKNKYYVDIHDNLTFLENGKQFIWTSEMSGYNHVYLYGMNGKKIRQVTKGNWEVTNFYGIDEKKGKIYYQAAEDSPMERHVYSANLKGKKKKKLTPKKGTNNVQFSSTYAYFVNTHSTANSPASYSVFALGGKEVRNIVDNSRLKTSMKDYGVTPVEFFDFKTSEGVKLNGWMIKPANFDENKEYPVFMTEYGGPGSQKVVDSWDSFNYWWYQMLAQKGYIVACVDNRGTGGRGEEFKKMTYLQLGKYETIDQIEAAKWLGAKSYVDKDRIGIFGWSYGGYLSSLCILKGNDVFKSAIAVAPVTSWKWYDTVYTERYMRTLEENEVGYKENSPVYFADQLKGNYLLVHGIADDNVHFQHAAEMSAALVNANKQFDTYIYTNKNHGIYGGPTRLHLYTKMTNFLLEKL
ncbi:MAG: alpha/beta fold hydrolase, partial [Saprospiraceae bacterium]